MEGDEQMVVMTKQEAAFLLQISLRAVERLIAASRLPATKLGRRVRLNRADVLALVPKGGAKPEVPNG